MNFIKRTFLMLIALIAAVVALLAAADNSDEVALKFLDYQSPVWPISWWILTAFVIGVLFGTVLNLVSNTRLRMDVRKANKTAAGRTKELDQAKAAVPANEEQVADNG
ncbi:MAG: LapA family protein [Pseudomonadales bacterium]|nr:LapA family protein [Pseudomonadales bacterium]MBO6596027.1 LapA family protein [Pseudomonadales bacterium]MBO6702647.1 LapA family protein [Pseudomonadales bacterium]MBO6822510.1 LapA family protein [Pseudomonadales bacterium]MBO7004739.1 LapA family protein [Pseudomonadales bacterium]